MGNDETERISFRREKAGVDGQQGFLSGGAVAGIKILAAGTFGLINGF